MAANPPGGCLHTAGAKWCALSRMGDPMHAQRARMGIPTDDLCSEKGQFLGFPNAVAWAQVS